MDINFSVQINAPREKVWSVLFDDATYREWTAAFHEGSYAETDWQEGSKALFLGPGGKDGMVSTIARNIPNEFLSIKHLGTVKDGVEDTTSEEVQKWAG
ncbi:MAG: SRPBCC domain-containing protein, partial [Ignavibacteria bacterium]|nr:SRPBCC domain-containing protein [Ignavibacteria bacterium]